MLHKIKGPHGPYTNNKYIYNDNIDNLTKRRMAAAYIAGHSFLLS